MPLPKYLATVRLDHSPDDFQQSGFAGTIRPDQTNAVALSNGQIDRGKEALRPKSFAEFTAGKKISHSDMFRFRVSSLGIGAKPFNS
jgi:hypothetical protein